jgi:hypothetical protein
VHDRRLLDEEGMVEGIPDAICIAVDLGFFGSLVFGSPVVILYRFPSHRKLSQKTPLRSKVETIVLLFSFEYMSCVQIVTGHTRVRNGTIARRSQSPKTIKKQKLRLGFWQVTP